jgi:hypothetical protein
MIILYPYEVCPFGSICSHAAESTIGNEIIKCNGLNPNRSIVFICELWAENYEKRGSSNEDD